MQFSVNGKTVTTDKDMKLLDFIRYELGLTGTKNGCAEGACGTCTVIIDGKATKSCVQKTSKMDGKSVITIEGLSDREKEVFSFCFAECGAVQCGFCIPGMIMCAKALIDQNPEPTREDVKKAIRGNICRCTGYIKIEDAILMAAHYFRENIPVENNPEEGKVGQRFRRIDAFEKALGTGVYTDDIEIEGMLYVSALRTPYPKARIKKIDTTELEKDLRCSGIIRAEDVPHNMHGHITEDWPVLYGEGMTTSYIGDAILLIASYDRYALDELKSLVKVEAEDLGGVFTPEEALQDKEIVHSWEKTNLYREDHIVRGKAEYFMKKADIVFEKTYSTPFTEHAFMEPECAVALQGKFRDHHKFMLHAIRQSMENLTSEIQILEEEITRRMKPVEEDIERICQIPGVGNTSAKELIAEIGVEMETFPSAAHLASWAGLCPGNNESAGKKKFTHQSRQQADKSNHS